MAQVSHQRLPDARVISRFERPRRLFALPVPDHPWQHGGQRNAAGQRGGRFRPADNFGEGQIERRRSGGQQGRGQLSPVAKLCRQTGRLPRSPLRDGRREAANNAGRRFAAQGGQLVQRRPPQSVDRPDRDGQPRPEPHVNPGAAVGGPAGASQTLRQRLAGDGPAVRGLRRFPLAANAASLRVLDGKRDRPVRLDLNGKADRDPLALPRLIGGAGGGEQPGVLPLPAPDAKHIPPGAVLKIAVGEALTGEDPPEGLQIVRPRLPPVQRGAVDPRDHRHILGPLHPSLQLEGGRAHLLQRAQVGNQAIVLEAQRMALVPAPVPVGQAAGLGALPPVARPPPHDGGKPALPRIAHTERSMPEDLDFDGTLPADGPELVLGQLPRQDGSGAAQPGGGPDPLEGVDAHLGAGVPLHLGRDRPAQPQRAQVLDDKGVGPAPGGLGDPRGGGGQLPVGKQGVEGQMHPHPANVAVGDLFAQLLR